MEHNQKKYIEYVMRFAEENKIHIWLSGSFLYGSATKFSDVDISVLGNYNTVNELIYAYGKPVYISYTHNPLGILIVIYEDGVAVDLEIIEKIDIADKDFFHTDDIKRYDYSRNKDICKKFSCASSNCDFFVSAIERNFAFGRNENSKKNFNKGTFSGTGRSGYRGKAIFRNREGKTVEDFISVICKRNSFAGNTVYF